MTTDGGALIDAHTDIPGCVVVAGVVHADSRGRFAKPYSAPAFAAAGLPRDWAECFWSSSQRGVVRGFHVQLPPSHHAKLLWAVSGVSHSVVIDLRVGSPAHGRPVTVQLDAVGGKALFIPPGVAHGFQALRDDTTLVYLVTSAHAPERDSGVRWDSAGVVWPLPVTEVSARDKGLAPLAEFKTPFRYDP